MKCVNCSKEITNNCNYCVYCGYPIKDKKLQTRYINLSNKSNNELIKIILRKDKTEKSQNKKIQSLTEQIHSFNVRKVFESKSGKRKIYVASSWRNEYYSEVVAKLREAGHDVYDFRNPPSGDPGFKWDCVSEDYLEWSPQQYRDMLKHPKAERQFHNDIEAMEACEACVLVLPSGRSAHTEAGWFAGRGKLTIAYIPEKQEPELMYKLFGGVCCSIEELIEHLK